MRILVISEDFRNDQYILKPLFERLLRSIGKPNAHIEICRDPLLGGVGEALKTERIREIVNQYEGMTDLFILCVDRDGDQGRRMRLDNIETEFVSTDRTFLAVNAWEEIETWALAGLDLPKDWRWQDIRAEVDVKENYFQPLARQRGEAAGRLARKPRGTSLQFAGSAERTSTRWRSALRPWEGNNEGGADGVEASLDVMSEASGCAKT